MKKIALDRLQNAEYTAMMNDIIALLDTANIDELNNVKDRLNPLVQTLDKGLMQVKKSEHTQNLAELDKVRDDYLRGLRTIIKAEHFAPDSTHQEHAKTVQILLNTYKGLEKENFRKQSELLGNLLAEFDNAPYQNAKQALNLQRWLDALKDSNDKFISLYNQRRDEDAKSEPINIKALRQDIDKHYHELVNLLNALKVLKPSETLTTLIATINGLIEKWQNTVAIRQGINKKQHAPADKPSLDSTPAPMPAPEPEPPIYGQIDE